MRRSCLKDLHICLDDQPTRDRYRGPRQCTTWRTRGLVSMSVGTGEAFTLGLKWSILYLWNGKWNIFCWKTHHKNLLVGKRDYSTASTLDWSALHSAKSGLTFKKLALIDNEKLQVEVDKKYIIPSCSKSIHKTRWYASHSTGFNEMNLRIRKLKQTSLYNAPLFHSCKSNMSTCWKPSAFSFSQHIGRACKPVNMFDGRKFDDRCTKIDSASRKERILNVSFCNANKTNKINIVLRA